MAAAAPDPRRWYALTLLCGTFFMVILDAAIVVVALPSIEADLGFSSQDLQWVLSAYALTFGGLLLLGGRAADLLGRRRVFMVGLGFFTVASLICGLAWSPGSLIAARGFQGIGAAIMTPTAMSILSTTFEEGAERNKALGVWGAMAGLGGTAGWLIGGPLTDGPGWPFIFYINIPVGVAGILLSPVLLRDSRVSTARRSYDPFGALSVTAAMGLLVYAVVDAPATGWSDPRTIGLFAGSALLLAVFVAIEARAKAPLLPLRFLRSRTIVGANLGTFVFSAVGYALPFVLTLYAQQVLGYSAAKFGWSSIVLPLGVVVGATAGQSLALKVGFRPVASAGFVLLAGSGLYLTQVSVGGSYFGDIFIGLALAGPGLGLAFVTLSIAALAGVADHESGLASGLSNTSFQIGGAVGVAVASTIVISHTGDFIAANGPGNMPLALTEGFQAGFATNIVFAAIGLAIVLALLGRPRKAPERAEQIEIGAPQLARD
ncbi:MAG TPA: MFS transporter [Mycobacteriales bacterium]|nr:MFS transporter [Mycobacteriales bacterium]